MHPRQPRSTLFPYTTLFRSHAVRSRARESERGAAVSDRRTRHRVGPPAQRRAFSVLARARPSRGRQRASGDVEKARDRKSTRLNSSHVAISYAVFCLKKKKK